jgi:hypothetical protein
MLFYNAIHMLCFKRLVDWPLYTLLYRVNTSKGYTRADLVKRLESLQVLPLIFLPPVPLCMSLNIFS